MNSKERASSKQDRPYVIRSRSKRGKVWLYDSAVTLEQAKARIRPDYEATISVHGKVVHEVVL